MTVESRLTPASVTYIPNPQSNKYNIDFQYLNNEEYVKVYFTKSDKSKEDLKLDEDYSVEHAGGNGGIWGIVTLNKSIENVVSLTVYRSIENSQRSSFDSQTLFADTAERSLDKLTMMYQDNYFNGRNDTYKPGNNINISEDNIISSEDTKYTAGENIEITDNVISAVGIGEIYKAGNGLQLSGTTFSSKIDGNTLSVGEAGIKGNYQAGTNVTIDGNSISATDTTYNDVTTIVSGLMSSADKTKLDGIAPGANVNVKADWNQTATTSDSYILNKPILATVATSGSYNDLSNKLTAGENIEITDNVISAVGIGEIYKAGENIDITSNVISCDVLGAAAILSYPWKSSTLPSTAEWQSVTYGNGIFVAISRNDIKALYSTDGVTWKSSTLPSTAEWQSVTYGNGIFVAISRNDIKALYSTDGVTWKSSTLPSTAEWQSVTYGNGKFVAVTSGSVAAYSDNGTTWASSNSLPIGYWNSVTFGNGKFVAVGNVGKIAYSTDGINWLLAPAGYTDDLISVCYGKGISSMTESFVAIGKMTKTIHSYDGIEWIKGTELPIAGWSSVCCGNGRFVAVSFDGKAAYSTDGFNNWLLVSGGYTDEYRSVIYGDGRYVAVAYGGFAANMSFGVSLKEAINYTAGDNITITNNIIASAKYKSGANIAISDDNVISLAGKNDLLYTAGENIEISESNVISATDTTYNDVTTIVSGLMSSADKTKLDGIAPGANVNVKADWNQTATTSDSYILNKPTIPAAQVNSDWNASTGVAQILNKPVLATVATSGSYNDLSNKLTAGDNVSIENNKVSAVDTKYTAGENIDITGNKISCDVLGAEVIKSYKWTKIVLPQDGNWYQMSCGGGKFVSIIDNSNVGIYSSDGINWNACNIPEGFKCHVLDYAGDRFIAIQSGSNKSAYSTDGINWTLSEMFTPLDYQYNWGATAYGGGKFVVLSNRKFACTADGINWTVNWMPSDIPWSSVAYGNGKFVAIAVYRNQAAYSTDGINWTATTMPSVKAWYQIRYVNDKFIAVSWEDPDTIAYSINGINWTAISAIPSVDNGLRPPAYGGGRFVIVSARANKAAYSDDGITWVETDLPGVGWGTVIYADGRFVAFGGDKSAYSDDGGVTWKALETPSGSWQKPFYSNNMFVVGGWYTNVAYFSFGKTLNESIDEKSVMMKSYPIGSMMLRNDAVNPETLPGFEETSWRKITVSSVSEISFWKRIA